MSDHGSERQGFDVEEAARLTAEVRELGFDAARMIVERFVELFDHFWPDAPTGTGASDGSGSASEPGPVRLPPAVHFRVDDGVRRRLQADAQRALESFLDVLRRVGELGLPFLDGVEPEGGAVGDGLELPDLAPGGRTSARLWLHNSTGSAVTGLRPWTSGLVSHDGSALGAELVTFRPDRVDRLDPGGSVEILVAVTAPPDARLGLHHGQILVEGLAATAFPARVRVVGEPGLR
ncbi:MAG: COG1470 family protein [Actinomycetota bacterium]